MQEAKGIGPLLSIEHKSMIDDKKMKCFCMLQSSQKTLTNAYLNVNKKMEK